MNEQQLLHHKFDIATYMDFFSHLSAVCQPCADRLMIGTDDEKALHVAIARAFPNYRLILGLCHLKRT